MAVMRRLEARLQVQRSLWGLHAHSVEVDAALSDPSRRKVKSKHTQELLFTLWILLPATTVVCTERFHEIRALRRAGLTVPLFV